MRLVLHVDPADYLRLDRLATDARPILNRHLGAATTELQTLAVREIRRHMHFTRGYSTGATYGSVTAQRLGPLAFMVGPTTPYAAFVEYGTGRRGAAAGLPTPAWYSYGRGLGMAPEPFMAPARAALQPILEQTYHRAAEAAMADLSEAA